MTNNACQGTNSSFWVAHISELVPADSELFIYNTSSNDMHLDAITIRNNMAKIKDYCDDNGIELAVVSPPPVTDAVEEEREMTTRQVNDALRSACSALGIMFMNLHTEVVRYYFEQGAESVGTYWDTVHPDSAMHRVLFYLYCSLFGVSPTGILPAAPADDPHT